MDVAEVRDVKCAAVELSASGNVVAAVSGKRIVVLGYVLTLDGAATVQWQTSTGPTDLSGPMKVAAGSVIVAPVNGHGWFKTAAGDALRLAVTGTVNVGGHVLYVEQ